MKTIQKIENNEAWERYVRIRQLKQHAEEMMLVIGAELYEFQLHEQYKPLGYESFEAFLADPEIDIARRTAYRMIRVYKTYILELNCATEQLTAAGISKLDMLVPYVGEENKVYMLNMASTLSRSDLHAELTNTEPKYLADWRSQFDSAIRECKQLQGNENTPQPLRDITGEYVYQAVKYAKSLP